MTDPVLSVIDDPADPTVLGRVLPVARPVQA
jgi:hypothetical protein